MPTSETPELVPSDIEQLPNFLHQSSSCKGFFQKIDVVVQEPLLDGYVLGVARNVEGL